jgi:NADPH:quinone reductase-like Zn-dependent oxidoreductase
MEAMVQHEHGEGGLRPQQRPTLTPGPGQVVVEVDRCGLNHLDLWLKHGGTGDDPALPRVPGADVLGRVGALGEGVTGLAEGTPVIVYPGSACEDCRSCAAGVQSACREFRVLGYQFDGGYARQVLVERRNILPVPDGADERWGAVPVAYVTAWNALVSKCGLTEGDTVVIWGAAGGLGNAALNIAAGLGARTVALVGSQDKVSWLRAQGYTGEAVVRSPRVVREVRSLCPGGGADVVLDHVGAQAWSADLKMLAPRGRLALCGVTSGPEAGTDLRYVLGKQLSIHGSWMGDRGDLDAVVAFLRDTPDALPAVERVFPLQEAAVAQQHLESGRQRGKTLLTMS